MLEIGGRGKSRPVTWFSLDGDLWITYRCTDHMSVCLGFFECVYFCLVQSSERT